MAYEISRKGYADICGPTVGDKIHLADTGLTMPTPMVMNLFQAAANHSEMAWE